MIKLTEFTSVVDTYKKNFAIRSKRFSDKKKKDQAANKEQREARIESKKFFSSVGAKVAEKIKPGSNILDSVIRFAGFTLLGLLVKNLDKVAAFAKQVIEKIKEFAVRLRKYFDDVLVPLYNDIVGLGTQIKNTFGDIANFVIRMNPYNELSDVLGTVMSGILALGYRIAGLSRPFTKPTKPGVTPPGTKAPIKKPATAKTPVKTPVTKPVKTPAKFFSRKPVRSPSVLSPTQSRSILRSLSRSLSRTLTGTPVGAGVGASGASGTGIPQTPSQIQSLNIDKAARELFERTFKAIDASKKGVNLPVAPPGTQTALEKFIRSTNENLKAVDPALTKAAGDAAEVRFKGGDELIGGQKPPSQQVARARLKGDLLRQGVPMTTGFEDLLRSIQSTKPSRFSLENINETIRSGLKKLTKGLDFRFDAKGVIKNQLLNPKNLLSNIKNFGVGIGLDIGARFLGKYISSILPYNEDFELLGYLGMIDPDRIHQLAATKIINLPKDKRRRVIKNLEADLKSSNDIFGTGQKKREIATAILKYVSIFSAGEFGSLEKPQIKQDTELERLEFPEHFAPKSDQEIKPGMIVPGEYTPEELKQLREIQKQFGSQSSVSKPSMVASVNRNVSDGLNGPTTYGNQGVMISREVVIAIQPVELPA